MAKAFRLLIALLLGLLFGGFLHDHSESEWLQSLFKNLIDPAGQIFLRLIFMIVIPMIFSALILGVFELGETRGLGRVFRRTIFFTILASSLSVFIGVGLVNFFQPGADFRIAEQKIEDVSKIQKNAEAAKSLPETLLSLIPRNPLEAATNAFNGEIIAFMIFCLLFGIALSMSPAREGAKKVAIPLLEQIFAASMKIIDWAMAYAPIGVFALVAHTAFKHGYGIFASLFSFVILVIVGLLIQQFVVYSALLKIFTRTSPLQFFKDCREVYLYAFSTASSNATLPKSLHTAQHVLKQPASTSRFVLTVGSTANQNGTALFEGITVLFLAQVYAIDLSFAQQVQVVLMSILAGIGTAGVPGGSLPLIMILMSSVGIPAEGMGLILGVDRFLDMCRTTLNVSGDLVISELVSHERKAKEASAA